MKIMKKILLLLLMNSFAAFSQNQNIKARFLINGALEFGGDDLAYVVYDDGHTQNINAGQGGTIAIGGELDFLKTKGLFLRGTLGYKYLTSSASNAHIRLTRIPIEISLNYNVVKKMWLGVGLVTHSGIKLNFDGLAENERFNSNLGTILKLGYGGLGISFTVMKYEGRYNDDYNANSFGLFFVIPIKSKEWK